MGLPTDYPRVVVTGIGVVTPLGRDLAALWASLLAGKSGIRRVTAFDVSAYDCKIAGEIHGFEGAPFFRSPRDARRCDRFVQLGLAAAKQALADSGIDLAKEDTERVGVMVGSGVGGLKSMEDQHALLLARGPSRLSPFMIPMMISNMASGIISMELGARGPNMAVTTACSTAANTIGESFHAIRRGEADLMFAGGSEATICPLGIGGFSAMRALSTRNDEPEKASRPFDRDRDGFVMAEGSGVLLLEEFEHARKRGARIYCEIVGYGNTADAHHMTAPPPEGEGAARCMTMALRTGRLNPSDISYINAHGTSTPLGDVCETKALKTVFGAHARKMAISSTKSMTGHLLGAAGSVEMAICAKAIQEDKIPPTINLDHPDPECDLDYVPNVARECRVDAILSNSFGFGGHNACIAARKLS
ncbi:MAG: beta-ketoacyl-ACP synthase II [Verrucomicrobiae bacterium]|nr:beta-ketoacyl-ACP synthase II [Verrucomicrobiae bacterium]